MNIDNLVHMANQIGDFFDPMPDREEALDGVCQHIRRYWAKRMREQFTAHWKDGGEGMSPIVREMMGSRSILPTPVPVRTADPVKAAEQHAWDGKTES
jgi:formate dehydrogenase subunit delta